MKKTNFVLLFIFAALCLFAQNADIPTVVVAPFDVCDKIPEKEASLFYSKFQSVLAKTKKVNVVDRKSLDKIKEQLAFQNTDWSDSDKVAELGRAANANVVITEEISDAFDMLELTINMIDVNTTVIISTASAEAEKSKDLFGKLSDVAQELVDNMDGKTSSKPKKQSAKIEDKTIASSTTTTTVTASTDDKVYRIGDKGPGGGIIFYVSEAGFKVKGMFEADKVCHYMEISEIISNAISWCSIQSDKKCCNPATETGIGTGRANTGKILVFTHAGGKITESNCAAMLCAKYSTPTTKAGDWWLPSKNELELIHRNVWTVLKAFEGYYWTSSSVDDFRAVMVSFDPIFSELQKKKDSFSYCSKNSCFSVRAVRAF